MKPDGRNMDKAERFGIKQKICNRLIKGQLNILCRNVKDERVIQWIKRCLKSGVMENGVVMETEEGSPQGGNISPLLANIYLNEFDQEYQKRGVAFARYADDIVLLAKSGRVARRLLETSTKYLEDTLKLKVNQEKSRVVSVYAIRNFKFLGFTLGKNGKGIYIRVHVKSWKKMKSKLKELSTRRSCQSWATVFSENLFKSITLQSHGFRGSQSQWNLRNYPDRTLLCYAS